MSVQLNSQICFTFRSWLFILITSLILRTCNRYQKSCGNSPLLSLTANKFSLVSETNF